MSIISNGHVWKYTSYINNKNYSFNKEEILKIISRQEIDEAYLTISKWENYSPTPLLLLNKLSQHDKICLAFQKTDLKNC